MVLESLFWYLLLKKKNMLGASEKGHDFDPSSGYLTLGSCAPQGLGGLLPPCLYHLHSKDHLWTLFQPQKSPTFFPALTLSFLTYHILTHHTPSPSTLPHPPHLLTHHHPSATAHPKPQHIHTQQTPSATTHPHPIHILTLYNTPAITHPHSPHTLTHH